MGVIVGFSFGTIYLPARTLDIEPQIIKIVDISIPYGMNKATWKVISPICFIASANMPHKLSQNEMICQNMRRFLSNGGQKNGSVLGICPCNIKHMFASLWIWTASGNNQNWQFVLSIVSELGMSMYTFIVADKSDFQITANYHR